MNCPFWACQEFEDRKCLHTLTVPGGVVILLNEECRHVVNEQEFIKRWQAEKKHEVYHKGGDKRCTD